MLAVSADEDAVKTFDNLDFEDVGPALASTLVDFDNDDIDRDVERSPLD